MTNQEIFVSYQEEFLNDEPIEIIDGFFIYPVTMKDYYKFIYSSSILNMEKNIENDVQIISMSYLDYLLYLIKKGDDDSKIYSDLLYIILRLVCKKDDITIYHGIDENNKSYLMIDEHTFYKKDFDLLRKAILIQNVYDYNDEYINPELKKDLETARKLRNKGKKQCDIEKQEMAVVIGSSLTLNDVRNMTIRKFCIALDLIDSKLHYIMYKTASIIGFVEFKEEIVHYLIEKDNSIEKEIIDYDQFNNKINNANG